MGQPAARVGDMHVCPMVTPGVPPVPHVGGPILPVGVPTVLIGGLPAATVGSMCTCVGPPDVIVRGSFSVLIGGRPAARMGDNTAHGGTILIGCPTVLIGDFGMGDMSTPTPEMLNTMFMNALDIAGVTQDTSRKQVLDGKNGGGGSAFGPGPLSEAQAKALFDKMAAQNDIAFAYPKDGCYARAHIMTQRMKALGVTPSGKAYTFSPDPAHPLHAKTNNDPNGYVEWRYHVAPTVQVKTADGKLEDRVIDPSLFDHPVTPEEWAKAQQPVGTTSPPILKKTAPGQAPSPDFPDYHDDADAAKTMAENKALEVFSKNSYKKP